MLPFNYGIVLCVSVLSDRVGSCVAAFSAGAEMTAPEGILYHGSYKEFKSLRGQEGQPLWASSSRGVADAFADVSPPRGRTHLPTSRVSKGIIHEVDSRSFSRVAKANVLFTSTERVRPIKSYPSRTYSHKEIPLTQKEALIGGAVLAGVGASYYAYRHRDSIKNRFHSTKNKLGAHTF